MIEMRRLQSAIRDPKAAIKGITHKLLATVGHSRFRRFIVLSRSRTGSNLLISLLNSHPNIDARGEIFSKLNGSDYEDILAEAFSRSPFFVKAKGFKIFYYHPLDDESCGIWNALVDMDDLYVIHLKRRNILRTMVSRKIAGSQDVWTSEADDQQSNAEKETITVKFTVDELDKGFKDTRSWEQAGEYMFKNRPMLSLDYEDLVDSRDSRFHEVTEFLGVDYRRPTTKLRKQNTKNLRQIVTNYQELKSAFSGTEWQQFFDD